MIPMCVIYFLILSAFNLIFYSNILVQPQIYSKGTGVAIRASTLRSDTPTYRAICCSISMLISSQSNLAPYFKRSLYLPFKLSHSSSISILLLSTFDIFFFNSPRACFSLSLPFLCYQLTSLLTQFISSFIMFAQFRFNKFLWNLCISFIYFRNSYYLLDSKFLVPVQDSIGLLRVQDGYLHSTTHLSFQVWSWENLLMSSKSFCIENFTSFLMLFLLLQSLEGWEHFLSLLFERCLISQGLDQTERGKRMLSLPSEPSLASLSSLWYLLFNHSVGVSWVSDLLSLYPSTDYWYFLTSQLN